MGIPRIQGYPMPVQMPADKTGWTLQASRAVLLVHDMQQYFVDFFDATQAPMPELIANIGRLIDACRAAGVPIVYTAQPGDQKPEDRALLSDFWGKGLADRPELVRILPSIAPQPQDTVMCKWRYSAFKRSSLEQWMAERGRDQLLICGVYAHIGCLMTAAEAFMLDIQAFLAGDALADFSRDEHEQALRYAAGRCARALTTEAALQALQPAPKAVLDRATLRAEVAEQIDLAVDAFGDEDDLLLIGLDSVRMMALADRWRSLGAGIDFATLAAAPTLAAWATLLCGEPAPDAVAATLVPAGSAADHDPLPLTQAQLGVLQGQQMAGDDSVFHAAECLEISGPLDVRRSMRRWPRRRRCICASSNVTASAGSSRWRRAPAACSCSIAAASTRQRSRPSWNASWRGRSISKPAIFTSTACTGSPTAGIAGCIAPIICCSMATASR